MPSLLLMPGLMKAEQGINNELFVNGSRRFIKSLNQFFLQLMHVLSIKRSNLLSIGIVSVRLEKKFK